MYNKAAYLWNHLTIIYSLQTTISIGLHNPARRVLFQYFYKIKQYSSSPLILISLHKKYTNFTTSFHKINLAIIIYQLSSITALLSSHEKGVRYIRKTQPASMKYLQNSQVYAAWPGTFNALFHLTNVFKRRDKSVKDLNQTPWKLLWILETFTNKLLGTFPNLSRLSRQRLQIISFLNEKIHQISPR